MKVYLVGGAVRDKFLNIEPKDNDYLVIGETVEGMVSNGFVQVAKNIPVFRNPCTDEEYALARIERKVGKTRYDFEFYVSPDITVEQDLERRDFTMNAIVYDSYNDDYIDPYNGIQDINDRVIRHINPDKFVEDPLRILRAARFLAKYHDMGFKISECTYDLMSEMVRSGSLKELRKNPILREIDPSWDAVSLEVFWSCLDKIGASDIIKNKLK